MGRPSKFNDRTVRERILLLVRGGNKLGAAASSCGVTRQTLHDWRGKAQAGDKRYVAFFEAVQRAVDEAEVNDVIVTARAANLDQVRVPCHRCGTQLTVTSDQLIALAGNLLAAQHVKASAAQVAFQRLSLRNPRQWSPRVTLTIEEEHNRFLDVAERVLAPEAFRLLLESYVAERSGDTPPPEAGSGGTTGGLH